ncbi:hypothetical protein PCE1_003051 [Barthelona sp. PCE]
MDVELSGTFLAKMRIGSQQYTESTAYINSLHFHREGGHLVSCSDDDFIRVHDCLSGIEHQIFTSDKYGCRFGKFLASPDEIIMASTRSGHDLRVLSPETSEFTRFLSGHTMGVLSLDVFNDITTIISTSQDRTVRLWDLRVDRGSIGKISVGGSSVAACSPDGERFAVALSEGGIAIYDRRNPSNGPMSYFDFSLEHTSQIVGAKFSPNSQALLLTGTEGYHVLYNIETGGKVLEVEKPLMAFSTNDKFVTGAEFSPDNKFLLIGRHKSIAIFPWPDSIQSLSKPEPFGNLVGHQGMVWNVGFNPKYAMFASAANDLCLWVPPQI